MAAALTRIGGGLSHRTACSLGWRTRGGALQSTNPSVGWRGAVVVVDVLQLPERVPTAVSQRLKTREFVLLGFEKILRRSKALTFWKISTR